MKLFCIFILSCFFSISLFAQQPPVKDTSIPAKPPSVKDTIVPAKGNPVEQLKEIKKEKNELKDSVGGQPKKEATVDTTINNKYGDLLTDDTAFNKKSHWLKPVAQIFGLNLLQVGVDKYFLKEDYARVGLTTWGDNLRGGWEWDTDRFGVNFIGHPYTGSMYFNAARSNGFNYVQSIPFAVGGSLMWEYFGEKTKPSYNDIVNTPINGIFFGEIFYRLSSNILDDRSRGGERVFREILAGLISPMRGFNRLMQGKTKRLLNKEVYQKEPLNITVNAGLHKINENQTFFGQGPTNTMINVQLDYGNPFEDRPRKPFDLFRLRTGFSFGVGRKILDHINGYGILFGRNHQLGKLSMLIGAFQYYDYWDNKSFELGAIALGAGAFFKVPINKHTVFYTNLHLGAIPFAGNSTHFGPDTSQLRDYDFSGGLLTKLESSISLGKYVTASLLYHYYMLRTYVGIPGNNFIGILVPRITIRLFDNLSVGIEQSGYADNRRLDGTANIHSERTEQKIFLNFYLEDSQRKGRYK